MWCFQAERCYFVCAVIVSDLENMEKVYINSLCKQSTGH